MRIEKWGFLLSYAIYLVFCIVYSIISKDNDAVNSMIFSITLASTAFSFSDFLFTKIDIDKKERESLTNLYYLTGFVRKIYINRIERKYGEKAEKILSVLLELFEGNENLVEKFFDNKLTTDECKAFFEKVELSSNEELIKFAANYSRKDALNLDGVIDEIETGERDNVISDMIVKQENRERKFYVVASCVAVLGLDALLIVLTIRIIPTAHVNNVLTIMAFLFAILNLIFKDYYKANSVKKVKEEKKKYLMI